VAQSEQPCRPIQHRQSAATDTDVLRQSGLAKNRYTGALEVGSGQAEAIWFPQVVVPARFQTEIIPNSDVLQIPVDNETHEILQAAHTAAYLVDAIAVIGHARVRRTAHRTVIDPDPAAPVVNRERLRTGG